MFKNTLSMNTPTHDVLIPREIRICYTRPLYERMKFIGSAKDSVDALHLFLHDDQLDYKECFWVLALTRSNRLLGISMIGMGSAIGVVVSTREIAQIALMTHASAVIVLHNHPSGCTAFSEQDLRTTRVISACLKTFDIALLDHIVITTESHRSMAEEGLLPFHSSTID